MPPAQFLVTVKVTAYGNELLLELRQDQHSQRRAQGHGGQSGATPEREQPRQDRAPP